MKSIDIIGLKNFRIFDNDAGFLEELSNINILTGANNSGKSTVIKSLQMLKNSSQGNYFPFDLDLTQQEHLLGDFDNTLFNKEDRNIVVSLPFPFLGIKNTYASLFFVVPSAKNTYYAKLNKIEVTDRADNAIMFSFAYRDATDTEKETYENEFQIKIQNYEQRKSINDLQKAELFSTDYLFYPFRNPLLGYIEWVIDFDKLRDYLNELLKFYELYLENKGYSNFIINADKQSEELWFTPSVFINSFKNQIDINNWKGFLEEIIKFGGTKTGKEPVGERDFEPDDFYFPVPEINDVLYSTALEIIRKNIKWKNPDSDGTRYSVIENCFQSTCKALVRRVSTIHYLSNLKEENLRVYIATTNSPFVNLLKEYNSYDIYHPEFINKYLKAFEIGKRIEISYNHKYQLISVNIITLENARRDLVDFGYGIKQLIIILIQITVLAEKNKRIIEDYDEEGEVRYDYYNPSILLIEEPETNLHPKWQSLLAELFVEAYKRYNIQLIIETHSEYLIRKFQALVADNKINGESIKIFYLRNLHKVSQGNKQIETTYIQSDGSINYQIFDGGFFDESDNLELSLLNIQRDTFIKEFHELKINKEENESIITGLEQRIDNYTNKLNISVYQQLVNQSFEISKLLTDSVKYLTSGQFLLHTIDISSDFSPVIIQYGRTIENELKDIFISSGISNQSKLMLGFMQGSLEIIKIGATTQSRFCSNIELMQLRVELSNKFNNPSKLKIELLDNLRVIRNSAGHSGQTRTKQEAIDYIQVANEFLEKWILEKK